MKAHILAIGGSNSRNSINNILASYAASRIENAEVKIADLNDYELPLYSSDLEKASGIPENAVRFMELIKSAPEWHAWTEHHRFQPTFLCRPARFP